MYIYIYIYVAMKKRLLLCLVICWCAVSAAAQHPAQDSIGAQIAFDKKIHLFGTLQRGDDGLCYFVVTNTGNAPLVVSEVGATCGCTVPQWSKEPIMPGGTDTIRVRYDTSRAGRFNKVVTVHSNAINYPHLDLMLRGNVQ